MVYKIKQLPEDFFVEEISNVVPAKLGEFTYFLLIKRNYTTEDAIQRLARHFNIKRKFFGYAGNKDKKAVTKQLCSVKGKIGNVKLKDLGVEVFGRSDKPISLGDLEGNRFEIVVRDIDELPKRIERVTNFFDTQRFGIKRNNHLIGKFILKKDFKRAVGLVIEGEKKREILDHLANYPNDYVGALRLIPRKILRMYINAYQSHVWNECVKEYIKVSKEQDYSVELPIVGFGTELYDDDIGRIIKIILKRDGIALKDFVIREIPELSSEGYLRRVFVEVRDLKIGKLEDDELNKGMKRVKICFSLPKGSYATLVIREMFNS